ncbi:MAG: DUF4920 domain-containing protein [Pseudomonadota bacterium]|nr:MAG: DUF4920 domain-containing protein [Pseudomonadota bacterium]
MHRRFLSGLAVLLLGVGCKGARSETSTAAPSSAPVHEAAPTQDGRTGVRQFGAKLGQSPARPLADILAQPDAFAGKTVTVEGRVLRACSRKGCWMELAPEGTDGPGCRVTFKDYGFFVPTDSAGSKARLEANVEVTRVEPAMVSHLEQEGARFAAKSDDGSAKEIRLVATGVELWR